MAEIIPLGANPNLGHYLRPGRLGAAQLRDVIAANRRPCDGIVIDPVHWSRQTDLARLAKEAGIETILDPRSLELASEAGRLRTGITGLGWYTSTLHTPAFLGDSSNRHEVLSEVVRFVIDKGLSGVLAPTHFIQEQDDPWLDVDDALTRDLRLQLDRLGGRDVQLYRTLYVHSHLIRNAAFLQSITARLSASSANGLWLGVHPFGTNRSGPVALRRYVDLCVALHRTGLPLVGMHTGTVGVLLMALGAISGIESGITDLEGFHLDQFVKLPIADGRPAIGSTPRIYIQSLGIFMTKKEATAFFGVRGITAQHACQIGCCRRGVEDTYQYRIKHFVMSRDSEVQRLSSVPVHLRSKSYLDEYLRPACDKAVVASRAIPSLGRVRRRLDDWRQTMTGILERHGGNLPSTAPALHSRRRAWRASV